MSDRLESALHDLHLTVTFPVDHAEWEWVTPPTPSRAREGRWSRRIALAAIGAIVVILLIAVPQVRQAVADFLGAAGIRIFVVDEPVQDVGGRLELGDPATLAELAAEAPFTIRVPAPTSVGDPDGVFSDDRGMVHMVWRGDPGLPAAGDTGIGVLFSQWAEPGVGFEGAKSAGPETEVEALLVEGTRGLWIEGAAHTLTLVDNTGREKLETTRLAANVLIWSVEGVNYRLETTGDLAGALAFVASLGSLD